MKILVTGSSGFIGSHLVDRLLQDGHTVYAHDLLPLTNLEWKHKKLLQWSIGNITDKGEALRIAYNMDVIYHLAQPSDIDIVQDNPLKFISDCIMGTALMLDAAVKVKRFIYASSTYVYGTQGHLYTTTKKCCESLIKDWHTLYGLPYTMLRLGTVYGGTGSRCVVDKFVETALANKGDTIKPLTIHGSGEQARRFIHIDDIVEGMVKAMQPQSESKTYTLVDQPISILNLANLVRGIVFAETVITCALQFLPPREDDYIENLPKDIGDNWNELDWYPQIDIEEGIRKAVERLQ